MQTLWTMPFPSSWGVRTKVTELPKRDLQIDILDMTGEHSDPRLLFRDVALFRCIYLPALAERQIKSCYDKLVATDADGAGRRLYCISFDDGPCYEVLASRFDA